MVLRAVRAHWFVHNSDSCVDNGVSECVGGLVDGWMDG